MKNNSRQLLFAGTACCFAVCREGRKIKTGPKSVTKTEKETSILDELASLLMERAMGIEQRLSFLIK